MVGFGDEQDDIMPEAVIEEEVDNNILLPPDPDPDDDDSLVSFVADGLTSAVWWLGPHNRS